MDRFQNKVILIAGGSRGIGAAVARRFSSLGGEVAIGYRTHRNAADALVSDIEAFGGVAKAFESDISRANSVEALVQNVIAHFGRIDVLVNCAAVAP